MDYIIFDTQLTDCHHSRPRVGGGGNDGKSIRISGICDTANKVTVAQRSSETPSPDFQTTSIHIAFGQLRRTHAAQDDVGFVAQAFAFGVVGVK